MKLKACRNVFLVICLLIGFLQPVRSCEGPVETFAEYIGVVAISNLIAFGFSDASQPQLGVACTGMGVEVTVDPTQPLMMSFFSTGLQTGYFEPGDFNECPNMSFGPFPGNAYSDYGLSGVVDFVLEPADLQNLIDQTAQFGAVLFGVESVACDVNATVIPMFFFPPPSPPTIEITKTCLSGDEVFIGQPVRFEIDISHTGGDTAQQVVITDTLPVELDENDLAIHSNIVGAMCTRSGRTITCQLGDLASGFSGKVWITTRTMAEGVIINSVQATGEMSVVFNMQNASCGFEILDLNVRQCNEFVLLEPRHSLRCSTDLQPVVLNAIAVGGTPPYSYLWLPPIDGGTSNTISVTPAQSAAYKVTVTDSLGCQVSKEVAVLVKTVQEAIALWNLTGPEFLPDQNQDGKSDIGDLVLFVSQCN